MVNSTRDPWRTAAILLAFLTEYNIVLGCVHVATSVLFGTHINPTDRVWDFREAHFNSIPGYRTCFVYLATACLMIPIEVFQIQRAKLILDFAMTAQCSHLLLTYLYSGHLPATIAWWTTWLVSSSIMVFGGEYLCMRIELRPIQFGMTVTDSRQEAEITSQPLQQPRMSTSSRMSRLSGIFARNSNDDIELQERETLMEEGQSSRLKP